MPYDSLHALAEHVPQIVWVAGPEGVAEYCNRRCQDYLGLAPHDLAGWNWQWSVHPADLTHVVRVWKFALRTGEPYHVEYRLRRADGFYRKHLGWALPIRDSGGQITHWFATCVDLEQSGTRSAALPQMLVPKNGR
jgi:PAS domain S-box-containing protein